MRRVGLVAAALTLGLVVCAAFFSFWPLMATPSETQTQPTTPISFAASSSSPPSGPVLDAEQATAQAAQTPPAATVTPTPDPRNTNSPEQVYYRNCTAVRAAGVAPIHRGQPGYSRKLDRDGDGVACES